MIAWGSVMPQLSFQVNIKGEFSSSVIGKPQPQSKRKESVWFCGNRDVKRPDEMSWPSPGGFQLNRDCAHQPLVGAFTPIWSEHAVCSPDQGKLGYYAIPPHQYLNIKATRGRGQHQMRETPAVQVQVRFWVSVQETSVVRCDFLRKKSVPYRSRATF